MARPNVGRGKLAYLDLISAALPFRRLLYGEPNATSNAIGYAQFYSRAHSAVIHVYNFGGNVVETHEHKGDFKGRSLRETRPIMTPALPNIT